MIEDSPTIRASLIPALSELTSVNVIAVAETAAEGIAALRAHDGWRLAVIDMFLKEGNGFAVLRAYPNRRPDQHMIVLTNYATLDIRQKSKEACADAVFDKSTEIDLFFDLCKELAARQNQSEPGG